jgi:predicted secreted protein
MVLSIKNTLKFTFLVVITAFLSKCGYPEIKKEAPEVNQLKKGEKFTIILPEDHRTGYIWQLTPGFDEELVENTNVVWHGNEKGVYYNFKTLQKGQATLHFVNRKYTDTLNAKTFIITILE